MSRLKATVSVLMESTIPRDAAQNTFHFQTPAPWVQLDLENIITLTSAFYNSFSSVIFPALTETDGRLKIWDLDDAPPRVPIWDTPIALGGGFGDSLPQECAICVSYKAQTDSGQPPGRRRGRIYLGPVRSSVLEPDGRISVGTCVTLANAARDFGQNLAGSDLSWEVYSPTDNVMRRIETVWVDNAFDTQRRRGVDPTERETRVLFAI